MFLNTEEVKPLEITLDEFHLLTNIDKSVGQYKTTHRKSDKQLQELITGLEQKGIAISQINSGVANHFRIPNHEHKEIKRNAVVNFYKQHKVS